MLSAIFRVSVCGPRAVGLNRTVMLQLEPAESNGPQVLPEIANSVPDASEMELIVSGTMPVLLSVTVWPLDIVLGACVLKSRAAGLVWPQVVLERKSVALSKAEDGIRYFPLSLDEGVHPLPFVHAVPAVKATLLQPQNVDAGTVVW